MPYITLIKILINCSYKHITGDMLNGVRMIQYKATNFQLIHCKIMFRKKAEMLSRRSQIANMQTIIMHRHSWGSLNTNKSPKSTDINTNRLYVEIYT